MNFTKAMRNFLPPILLCFVGLNIIAFVASAAVAEHSGMHLPDGASGKNSFKDSKYWDYMNKLPQFNESYLSIGNSNNNNNGSAKM